MELWDAYYRDGTLANRTLVRGELVPEGLYHLGRFNRPSGETTVGFMQKVFGEK